MPEVVSGPVQLAQETGGADAAAWPLASSAAKVRDWIATDVPPQLTRPM